MNVTEPTNTSEPVITTEPDIRSPNFSEPVCSGNETFEDMEVECDSEGIQVEVSVCAFLNINMNPRSAVLRRPGCNQTFEDGMISYLVPPTPECGTEVENNGTHLLLR